MNRETGIDRITRAQSQAYAMCQMLDIYLEGAESGDIDALAPYLIRHYVWALSQNLEAIDQGVEEMLKEVRR